MFAIPHLHLSKSAVLGLSVLAAIAAVPAAQAQTQNTYDAQIPFSFSSPTLVSPRGIAVAPDGTVYIADVQSSTTGRVVRITPTTGTVGGTSEDAALLAATAVALTPSIPLKVPTALAIDSTGALYIADAASNQVIKMANPEGSSAATAVTYPATETPTALAVDSSNNLYIADETQKAIYEVVGGTATQLAISPNTLQPVGLAVDASGNVYFADASSDEIYKYTASTLSTAAYLTTSSAGAFAFSSTTEYPIGMGFDSAGSLYILDNGSGFLIQVTSPSTSTANVRLPLSTTLTPAGLAVSSIGNLYVADDAGNTADEVYYNNNPFNFGSLPAGTSGVNSPAVTVNFQFNNGATGLAIYQSMQGDITTEFHTSNYTCAGGAGTTCSMAFYVNYSSALPGRRSGVVGLTDNAGDILAVPNTGIGLAGSLALYPGTMVTLAQGSQPIYEPQGLAVTGDGRTLFVADEGGTRSGSSYSYSGSVWAYNATGGNPTGTPTRVGSFPTPLAVALDPRGDLYVADYGGSNGTSPTVTEIPVSYSSATGNIWPGFGTTLSLTGSAALNHPMALAFDPWGNLYIGDMGPAGTVASASNPGYIIKVPADGGPAIRLNYTVGGIPIVFPQALATDSQGNLYIADGGDGDTDLGGVDVVPVATGTASAISFGSFGQLSQPSGLGFDAANDLYVLDGYNQRILVVPITYTGTVPVIGTDVNLLGAGSSGLAPAPITPSNMVIWPGGQYITIADLGLQTQTGTADPPQVLTLQSVNETANLTSGPATFTGINVGNQEITFAPPGNTEPTDFTLSNCGAGGGTLATGIANSCSSTVTYTGTTYQTGVVITYNGTPADDYSALGNTITVSGGPTEPVASLTGGTYALSTTGTATLTNNGGLPLIISNIQATGKDVTAYNTGTCVIGGSVPAGQSCTVVVTFQAAFEATATVTVTDNSGGVLGSQQTATITVYGTISLVEPARPYDLPAVDIPRNVDNPTLDNPTLDNPTLDNPNVDTRDVDNRDVDNRDVDNRNNSNPSNSSNDSSHSTDKKLHR